MQQMHFHGVRDQCEAGPLCSAFRQGLALWPHLLLSAHFASSAELLTLPQAYRLPFPDVASRRPTSQGNKSQAGNPRRSGSLAPQRDESPATFFVLNFLDDANASDHGHKCRQRRAEDQFGQTLGVQFWRKVDTKKCQESVSSWEERTTRKTWRREWDSNPR